MRLDVCTPAFYPDERGLVRLKRTAEMFGIKVHPYGVGRKWENFVDSKMLGLRKFAQESTADLVLMVDSIDALFCGTPDDIISGFVQSGAKKVLVAGDKFLFPRKNLYSHYWGKDLLRYPCAGVILGTRRGVIGLVDAIVSLRDGVEKEDPYRDDDQGWIEVLIAKGLFPISIDSTGRTIVSCAGIRTGCFCLDGGRIDFLGNKPSVLHFPGKSKGRQFRRMFAAIVWGKGLPRRYQ
jgi:hypothetical protein